MLTIAGCSGKEQVEVCPQGWHDTCEWEGLSVRQVHLVRTSSRSRADSDVILQRIRVVIFL